MVISADGQVNWPIFGHFKVKNKVSKLSKELLCKLRFTDELYDRCDLLSV